jgi:hypothetical protein
VLQGKAHIDTVNSAMAELATTTEEAKGYKDQMGTLNKNLRSLNSVYGNVLSAMTGGNKA